MARLSQFVVELVSRDTARFVVAVIVVIGLVLLLMARINVPEAYWVLAGAVIGFYFGGNVSQSSGGT